MVGQKSFELGTRTIVVVAIEVVNDVVVVVVQNPKTKLKLITSTLQKPQFPARVRRLISLSHDLRPANRPIRTSSTRPKTPSKVKPHLPLTVSPPPACPRTEHDAMLSEALPTDSAYTHATSSASQLPPRSSNVSNKHEDAHDKRCASSCYRHDLTPRPHR